MTANENETILGSYGASMGGIFQGILGLFLGSLGFILVFLGPQFQGAKGLIQSSQGVYSRCLRSQSRIPRVFVLGSQVSSRAPLGFSSFVSTGHKDYHCLLLWGLYPFLWANGQVLWANKQGWQSPQIVNSLKLFDS